MSVIRERLYAHPVFYLTTAAKPASENIFYQKIDGVKIHPKITRRHNSLG